MNAQVTQILQSMREGGSDKVNELIGLVYDELRSIAASKFAREKPGQTLQATALVHEAYLRLVGSQRQHWRGRDHFFAAAAEAMRRILVEAARRKLSLKRGAGAQPVSLEDLDLAADHPDDQILAVSEALDRLAGQHPDMAELIKLRFFVGLNNADAARAMGLAERTAKRMWAYARVRLFEELKR